jgi:hypothetical protein
MDEPAQADRLVTFFELLGGLVRDELHANAPDHPLPSAVGGAAAGQKPLPYPS